ncbi:MAG: ORF6N domain-containing protein, partial [Desulfobacteraceae bacterium]|nr:ORF6N domain-containing protein [Desulfobacteraceae bacterium]
MLDRDLAELYEVETKVLKRNVRRNISRFPQDSMFELTPDEFQHVRSQTEERFQVVFTVLDKLVSDENALKDWFYRQQMILSDIRDVEVPDGRLKADVVSSLMPHLAISIITLRWHHPPELPLRSLAPVCHPDPVKRRRHRFNRLSN